MYEMITNNCENFVHLVKLKVTILELYRSASLALSQASLGWGEDQNAY